MEQPDLKAGDGKMAQTEFKKMVADDFRIFIVEGLITMFFSIFAFIFIPNFPAKDKWLDENDKQMLLTRLEVDKGKEKDEVSKEEWIRVLLDYKIWLMLVLSCPCQS